MTMIMTEQEARALARALELMRPTWQAAGITAALGQARLRANKWTVALAAINAAADDENRTPAVIAMDGKHWPVLRTAGEFPRYQPTPPLSETERDAAHVAYLQARAVLLAAKEEPMPDQSDADGVVAAVLLQQIHADAPGDL